MTFKSPDAFATFWPWARQHAFRWGQLPHLDGLVETAADEISAVWRKCHGIDTVPVPLIAVQAFDEVTAPSIPHSDTLIE